MYLDRILSVLLVFHCMLLIFDFWVFFPSTRIHIQGVFRVYSDVFQIFIFLQAARVYSKVFQTGASNPATFQLMASFFSNIVF